MPLKKGTSRVTTRANFEEFGKGRTYERTKKRYGKRRADKQRIAVVLSNRRRSKRKRTHHRER